MRKLPLSPESWGMAITSLRRDILLDKEMVLLPFFYFIKEKESKMTWIYLIFAGILEVSLGNEYEIK